MKTHTAVLIVLCLVQALLILRLRTQVNASIKLADNAISAAQRLESDWEKASLAWRSNTYECLDQLRALRQ